MKPKIVIFIYSLGPGGAERVTALLAKELLQSFEIHIALLDPTICYPIPDTIPVHILTAESRGEGIFHKLWAMVVALKNFTNLVRRLNVRIVLATLNRPIWIATFAKLLGVKFRLIISEHTMQSHWRAKEPVFSAFKRLLITALYPKSDAIITVSEGIRHDLINTFGLAKTSITTIYNPFDLDAIARQSQNPVLPILSPGSKRIITAGTLKPLKHHALLINALALISGRHPLIVLGEGELRTALQSQIDRLHLCDRVLMGGFIANPYPYFAQSDIFVLTSDFEGLPSVIIEAMACGCAVISTDCPSGPREILSPGSPISKQLSHEIELAEYGILVPVGNTKKLAEAIQLLIDNPTLLENYRNKALIRAKNFDKSILIPAYIRTLKGLQ